MEVVNIQSMKMMKELCAAPPDGQNLDYLVIPGRCAATNDDVRLHIRESRDSGSGAAHHPGMTNVSADTWIASLRS
jgi:hypothetical protein